MAIKPFPDPELSLWQSAVDKVVATHAKDAQPPVQTQQPGQPQQPQVQTMETGAALAAAPVPRPDQNDGMVAATATMGHYLENNVSLAQQAAASTTTGPQAQTEGVGDWAKYCSSIWWEIAKAKARGDQQAEQDWRAQLGAFGTCDPRYAEAAEEYVKYFKLKGGKVPYKVWTKLDDFIIDWPLPAKARIAILGDWGTGQQDAVDLLAAVARKKPDVVMHLGDVYYSGTEFEMNTYFLTIWKSMLDLTKMRTFSLSGNHDMYSGGQPYYGMIADLGQPASYFCLRNADWQFVALDTGLHDDDAFNASPTYLEDTEVQWLKDKMQTAGGRRTVLLSHHQLFTAFDSVGGDTSVNPRLSAQIGGLMPEVTVWFWGHEHNQVIYEPYQGVLARCVGHAAYPVGITEIPDTAKFPEVPVAKVTLAKGPSFYSHGYAIMDLDGPRATASYYQTSDPEDQPMFTETFA
jgi:predicted phosphodiesterase